MPKQKRFIGWLLLALVVVGLDHWSKWLVIQNIPLGSGIRMTSFFDLVFVFNPGAAFSFLADGSGWQRWFFIALAVVIVAWLVKMTWQHAEEILQPLAFSLLIGGAIGNVIDRIIHGKVVDFLHFHLHGYSWPAFNLADSAICLGVALMLIAQWRESRQKPNSKDAA